MGALFIPFGDALAVVLLGEAWRETGPIMMALAGMGIALAMQSVPSEIFKASGHPEVLPRLHALWFATSVGLMIALLPFGALGVAWAWSLSTIFVALYAVSRVPRVVPVRLREILTAIFPPLVTSLSAATALHVFNRYVLDAHPEADAATLGTLLLEIVAGAVLYVGGMAVLARGTLNELLHTAASIVRRRRRPHIEAELH